jgi:hypothetical protein
LNTHGRIKTGFVTFYFLLFTFYQESIMSFIRPVVLATVFTVIGSAAWAVDQNDHTAHHPDGAVSAKAPATDATAKVPMAKMDSQMKAMQAMHDKMMAAKTPEERNALMAEQMKLMQGGMGMMGGMGPGSMAGKSADMVARQGMMEQRMDMMQSMMQMMMDRMAPDPATK